MPLSYKIQPRPVPVVEREHDGRWGWFLPNMPEGAGHGCGDYATESSARAAGERAARVVEAAWINRAVAEDLAEHGRVTKSTLRRQFAVRPFHEVLSTVHSLRDLKRILPAMDNDARMICAIAVVRASHRIRYRGASW